MTPAARHRSADAALGYAADRKGRGIAYAAIATGTGTTVVRLPFNAPVAPDVEGRSPGFAAVASLGSYLRARGFTRVRIRVPEDALVDDLNARRDVPPALTMEYVKTRCILHGFAAARVERAEPIETRDLEGRARADIVLRSPAAA
jgi:hypothetical protein